MGDLDRLVPVGDIDLSLLGLGFSFGSSSLLLGLELSLLCGMTGSGFLLCELEAAPDFLVAWLKINC